MPFSQIQFEEAGGDWAIGYYCNRILQEVAATRQDCVDRADYKASSLAWKFAILRQCLTYRVVDLVESTMTAWGAGKWLSAIVIGRSVLETVALVHYVETQARKHLDAKELEKLDQLAMREIYSAKAGDYLLDEKFVATNILSALERFDKAVPAVRQYYDTLSEYAHPNAKGHYLLYGKLDKNERSVNFSPEQTRARGTVRHVTSACLGIIWAQLSLANLDQIITEISATSGDATNSKVKA
jgi:hypothetical protein